MTGPARVCLGVITGPHGVRGLVKLRSFCAEPGDLFGYGLLQDEAGRRTFSPVRLSEAKGQFIARIEGVGDRNAAEALRNTRLYVDRDVLPPPEEDDEFYHADLIGLEARLADGTPVGRVRAVFDHGAGDVIEIAGPDSGVRVLPFTKAVVPTIDLTGGYLVVDPPAEIVARPDEAGPAGAPAEATGEEEG